MACRAAIEAVYRALPPCAGVPVSDLAIFIRINWWVIETIREALVALMDEGRCEAESTTRGILYRRSRPPVAVQQ